MWLNRMRKLILDSGNHVLVRAGERWGFGHVLVSLREDGWRIIYVELDESDSSNSIRQGNRLSDGIYHGTGARLFGLGVPISYGLSLVKRNRGYLTPAIAVLKGAKHGAQISSGLSRISSTSFRLIEIVSEEDREYEPSVDAVIDARALAVTVDEAIEMYSTHIEVEEIRALWAESEGAYAALLALVNRRLALPPPVRPDLGGVDEFRGLGSDSLAVLDFLIRERRWIEAFELAIRSRQFDTATAIIAQAGEAYFEAGLFTAFWDLVRAMPEETFSEDIPSYWLLSAAIATNRQDEVRESMWSRLQGKAMPNARALMACSNMTSRSLAEAESAFSSATTVMTVRAMSHCLSAFGRPSEALKVALDHLPEVETVATPRELANCSYTVSRTLLFLGRYSAALEWVNWGMKIYQESRLKEELLRLSLVSAQAYYSLLLGDTASTSKALASISLDKDLAGIPSMEAVFSTAGDLALISGYYREALNLYSTNHAQASREILAYSMVDLVGALIMSGQVDKARAASSECHSLAAGTHERNAALARLAVGIANAHSGLPIAKSQLTSALDYFYRTKDSIGIGRAALHLAQVHLLQSRQDRAMQVLIDAREHLDGLGQSGWLLLGLPTSTNKELWKLYSRGESYLHLRVLGTRTVSFQGTEHSLSLRNAELLAILASVPSGINGERLSLELYGDSGNIGTVKSTISKLRQLVPISSRPYALGVEYEADHVLIQRLISEGRTADALELFRGPLLPDSEAPGVERLREVITEGLRQAVLASGDRNLMLQYCSKVTDDLDVVEQLHEQLDPEDPQYASVLAQLINIRKEWGVL